MKTAPKVAGRLGILVGGGPAPGINGVIAAATAAAACHGLEVVGICEGFKWLARGNTAHVRLLVAGEVELFRDRGGSILRTSRENPTRDAGKMAKVAQAIRTLHLDYLVTIGGDDTALSAYRTAGELPDTLGVVHVPKTIDNDLPLPAGVPTFGFETARHVGAQLVRNLVEDARTTNRWYLVVAMGRSVGHLALGIGAAAGASVTIIPEEFAGVTPTLESVCTIIEQSIAKSKAAGRDFGVAVIAEGLIGLLAEELKAHPLCRDNPLVEFKYDAHKHLRQDGVPLGLILKQLLTQRAEGRNEKLNVVDMKLGYELRCADPIPFDVEYTQQLGRAAVNWLVQARKPLAPSLVMAEDGEYRAHPLREMLDPVTGRMRVRPVVLDSVAYRQARAAMIR